MTTTETISGGRTRIDRRAFVADLVAAVPVETLFVTGLGSPSYDLFAAGDRDRNFYLWGAMGGAVPVGLGLALAQRDVPVVVLTGDGEQLWASEPSVRSVPSSPPISTSWCSTTDTLARPACSPAASARVRARWRRSAGNRAAPCRGRGRAGPGCARSPSGAPSGYAGRGGAGPRPRR